MRRPAPLPASPSTPRESAAEPVALPVRQVAPPRAEVDTTEADTTEATATEATATEAAATDAAATDAVTTMPVDPRTPLAPDDAPPASLVDDAPSEFDGVGVREVWAAARARRRALRAEVRRFTVRQRRRRMLWIGTGVALVLLVLGTLGAAYSPLFAVEQVRVVGTSTLDAAAVEAALSDQLGRPLPLVDSSEVKAALVQFPLVESYTLEARPPHELVVRIVERTPIGAVASAAGYTLVDAAGVALSTTPDPPAGFPVIDATGGIGSAAFDAIGTVFRALPADIRTQVTAMSATTANDVTLTLGGTGTEVVWGNADRSAYKAVVLAAAMAARPPEQVYTYDVSSPDAVVIR
ncbi:FtsQ-type POTRA domain-containing protein [Microbacterium sp.]|uniref:FtsQ-type POTRA domain-containing protein n=1 Tax=Microbacterium sp. TaxID=51671 RepID=UPI0039E6FE03